MIESGFPGLVARLLGGPVGAGRHAARDRHGAQRARPTQRLRSPEMKAGMTRLGISPSIGSVKDFADFIADEAPKWADIVKVAGVQVE